MDKIDELTLEHQPSSGDQQNTPSSPKEEVLSDIQLGSSPLHDRAEISQVVIDANDEVSEQVTEQNTEEEAPTSSRQSGQEDNPDPVPTEYESDHYSIDSNDLERDQTQFLATINKAPSSSSIHSSETKLTRSNSLKEQFINCQIDVRYLMDPLTHKLFGNGDDTPITLPCGHTFSAQTMKQLAEDLQQQQQQQSELKCPTCEKIIQNDQKFGKNKIIGAIIQSQNASSFCYEHDQQVQRACLTCYKGLCIDCIQQHQNHEIVTLNAINIKIQDYTNKMQGYGTISKKDIQTELSKFSEKAYEMFKAAIKEFEELYISRLSVKAADQILAEQLKTIVEATKGTPFAQIESKINLLSKLDQLKIITSEQMGEELVQFRERLQRAISDSLHPESLRIDTLDRYRQLINDALQDLLGENSLQNQVNGTNIASATVPNSKQPLKYEKLKVEANLFQEQMNQQDLNGLKILLKKTPYLKKLHLNFIKAKVADDQFLVDFSKSIKEYKILEELSLEFGCELNNSTNISDNGLSHINANIKELTHLNYLQLHLKNCDLITDNEIKNLAGAINASNQTLIHLNLNFELCNKVSNGSLEGISKAISKLTHLQKLELDFKYCDQIGNQGVSYLSRAMESNKSLKLLNLNFECCYQMGDLGVVELCLVMRSLPLLTKIYLNFKYCNQITNKGLVEICSSLKIMKQIKILDLNFHGCVQLSDSGLCELAIGIKRLIKVYELNLCFYGCDQITNLGVRELAKNIKTLVTIKNLGLNFGFCHQVTRDTWQLLADITHNLPLIAKKRKLKQQQGK